MSDTRNADNIQELTECVEYPFPQMLPEPEFYHYYYDMANRIFWIESDIDDSMSNIIKNIISINQADAGMKIDERKPIFLCINCDGGESDIMWSLIDAINASRTPITTINIGRCYSAAALIYLAGHARLTMPSATFMLHDGSAILAGDYAEIGMSYDMWSNDVEHCRDYIVDSTNITEADLDEHLGTVASHMRKDWYIKAKDAIQLGIADEMLESFEKVFGA